MFTYPLQFLWMAVSVWVWWMWRNGWSGLSRGRAHHSPRLPADAAGAVRRADGRAEVGADPRFARGRLCRSTSRNRSGRKPASKAAQFVARAWSRRSRRKTTVGLVTFGKNAAVEVPARQAVTARRRADRLQRPHRGGRNEHRAGAVAVGRTAAGRHARPNRPHQRRQRNDGQPAAGAARPGDPRHRRRRRADHLLLRQGSLGRAARAAAVR